MTDAPQDPTSGDHIPNNDHLPTTPPQDVPAADQTVEQPYASIVEQPAAATQPVNPEYSTTSAPNAEPAGAVPPAFGGGASATSTSTPADTGRRNNRVGLIAALAVGALIGGVSGAGVTWAVSSNQPGPSSAVTNSSPQNVTVNNTDSVNVVTAVAAKASPSVVTISVTSKTAAGTGSGIILSKDGYVLTNTHVVTLDGAIADAAVKVTTSNGHIYDATVVGTDPIVDLAVIKLKDATDLTPAAFADSSKLNVGETAIAIGAPLGLSNTVTNGIVSALNRSISIASSAAPKSSSSGSDSSTPSSPFDFWQFNNGSGGGSQGQSQAPSTVSNTDISLPVIQTDAAINPGNSGGALLNSDAKVIGINVAIASAGQTSTTSQSGSIGVGFAITANLAQRVAKEIIDNGKATHGLLGAGVGNAADTSSSPVIGASIKNVSSGGAADKAGIKVGDVVTTFNGVPVTSSVDLTAQVRFLAGGSTTDLTYVRNGTASTVKVTLGSLKQ